MPFYAGWGLTADMIAAPRRGRRRSLDEISAISFFRYARYWDPAAGLPCPAEVIVDRLARERAAGRGSGSMLGVAAGRAVILARRMRKMWGGSTGEQ
jgi:capsular polysaccharide export protein